MRVLLDENFPLMLWERLRAGGWDAEHIIKLGRRGVPDAIIRQRLQTDPILFLTQDLEFLDPPKACKATIVVSRVPQSLPIRRRVEIWEGALTRFAEATPAGQVFELFESGLVAGTQGEGPAE